MAAHLQGLVNQIGVQQYASITLGATQLKSLVGTPVTVIPAPGPGFMIVPYFAYFKYNFKSIAYANTGNALTLQIDVSTPLLSAAWTGTVDQVVNRIGYAINPLTFPGSRLNASLVDNRPLVAINSNGTDLTNGDGTVTVYVAHFIFPCNL